MPNKEKNATGKNHNTYSLFLKEIIEAELKCHLVILKEMDSQAGQVPDGWC